MLTPGDYLTIKHLDEGLFLAWLEGGGPFLVRAWYYDSYGWASPPREGYRYAVFGGPNGSEDLSEWPKHWRWRPLTLDLLVQWVPEVPGG